MQIQNNPSVMTIEGDLFKAFAKAGAISPENADDLKKNGFMRAARTDKGVHAAGNVISCKLIIEDEDILEKINKELPPQIRVWGIERTNKSFDCRKMCSSRIYEYLLPTYTLLSPKPKSVLASLIEKGRSEHPDIIKEDEEGQIWWKETLEAVKKSGVSEDELVKAQNILDSANFIVDNDLGEKEKVKIFDDQGQITEIGKLIRAIKLVENKRRREYRVSTSRLNLFRDAMKQYEGSHNFHNFTLGKLFKDPSARRFIKDTLVSDPFVIEGTEWVSIKIHGQSFMLHQIRKMIALAVLVVRTSCPISRIRACFGPSKVNIPKAPALGLLLECPVYEGYNTMLEKFGYNKIEFSQYEKEMNEFKMKYIYDKIYAEEVKENAFYGFFGFIDTFKGKSDSKEQPIFDFLGATFDSGLEDNTNNGESTNVEELPAAPQENVD